MGESGKRSFLFEAFPEQMVAEIDQVNEDDDDYKESYSVACCGWKRRGVKLCNSVLKRVN